MIKRILKFNLRKSKLVVAVIGSFVNETKTRKKNVYLNYIHSNL